MSLFQKGPNGEERTEVEHTVFKKSLSNMMEWYAHPKVFTFKLTRLPKGYPTGFKFPPGVEPNLADYEDRCERCLLTHHTLLTHKMRSSEALFCARSRAWCSASLTRVVGQQPDQATRALVLDLGKFDEDGRAEEARAPDWRTG